MTGLRWKVARRFIVLACVACLALLCARNLALLPAGAGSGGSSASLYAHKAPPGRWRGNNYIADGGLLPYQRCGAADFAPGPPRVFSPPFAHAGRAYRLVASALSLWGATTRRGRPTRAPVRAELLVTIALDGEPCAKAHWHHCATERIAPPARCRLAGKAAWLPARLRHTQRAIKDLNRDLNQWESVMASTIDCYLGPDFAPGDEFALEFEVGGGGGGGGGEGANSSGSPGAGVAAFAIPACYQHVEEVQELALCTQPHYNYTSHAAYFEGEPPYPHRTSLVDAFLLYHTQLQGGGGGRLGVVFQDLDGSFSPALQPYAGGRGGAVRYRPHWELTPGLRTAPGLHPELEHQSFAESTCFWEQRISARWTMTALSVDCFLLPARPSATALSALSAVDAGQWAELSVTAVQGFSHPTPTTACASSAGGCNVLQRYPLLDRDFATEFWRTMPIGNPRLHDFSMVHWMEYGKRQEVMLPVMLEREVLGKVGLQVLHREFLRARARATAQPAQSSSFTQHTLLPHPRKRMLQ